MYGNAASQGVARRLGFVDVGPMISDGRLGRRFQLDF
jgi:hypothetical protein